jgi:hypothetical protein
MSRIRLYIDEDAMQHALVIALRARRVEVATASECGMINQSDQAHLEYACSQGRALYSFNIRDYALLHEKWIAGGLAHCGIVLAPQQRYSVGEQLRRLLLLLSRRSAAQMTSRLEFLSVWGRDDQSLAPVRTEPPPPPSRLR